MNSKLQYLSKTYAKKLSGLIEQYANELDACKSIADAYEKLDKFAEDALKDDDIEGCLWMFVSSNGKGEELNGIIMATECCDNFAHDHRELLIKLVNDEPTTTGVTDSISDNMLWTMTYFAGYIDCFSYLAKDDRKELINLLWYDILGEPR